MTTNQAHWELLLSEYAKNPRLSDWQSPSLPVPFDIVDSAFNRHALRPELLDDWNIKVSDSNLDDHQKQYSICQLLLDVSLSSANRRIFSNRLLGTITIRKINKNQTGLVIKSTGVRNRYFGMVITTFLIDWMTEREIDRSTYWQGQVGNEGETAVSNGNSEQRVTRASINIVEQPDMNDPRNFEWECERCKKRFLDKERIIGHVLVAHNEGLIVPDLSQRGRDLAKLLYRNDLTPELSIFMNKEKILKEAGIQSFYVERGESMHDRNAAVNSATEVRGTMSGRGLQNTAREGSNETAVSKQGLEATGGAHILQEKPANSLQPKPAGRPPDPINDETYQLLLNGNDQEEAFTFWCKKNGITEFSTSNERKRARDAFRKAMKRAEQRRHRT